MATYKCEICNKEYNDVVARAQCELACAKRVEEEAKKAAEAKKKEEHASRLAEVEEAINHAAELLNEYAKDYGAYSYGRSNCLDNLIRYFL